MDIGSSFAQRGLKTQHDVCRKIVELGDRLGLGLKVMDVRSDVLVGMLGVTDDNVLNMFEKRFGDVWAIENGRMHMIEVCSSMGSDGISIGRSKLDKFYGTHFCMCLCDKDGSITSMTLVKRETFLSYVAGIEYKKSTRENGEDYKWISKEKLLGLRCGVTLDEFVGSMRQ